MDFKTADLCDQYPDKLQIAEPIFSSFGGRTVFSGPIVTLKVFEDNSLVSAALARPGHGRVLVVDGGGSLHCALLDAGPVERACNNGWVGVVINGCIRHSAMLAHMDIGIKALAIHPLKSTKRGVGEQDTPVRFAGIYFASGEYLYADEDGLVVAPQSIL